MEIDALENEHAPQEVDWTLPSGNANNAMTYPGSTMFKPQLLEESSNQSSTSGITTLSHDTIEDSSSRKRPLCKDDTTDDDDNDDGTLCPICLDSWTNIGDHRICALKCGHLFGYKCVSRWLQSQTKKSCPTCKKKVGRNDIRYIYAKKLIAMDNSEIENFKKDLNAVVGEKNRILCDLTRSFCREQTLKDEIADLKKEIFVLRNNGKKESTMLPQKTKSQPRVVKLFMDKSLEVCKSGGCRVLDASYSKDLLVASVMSPNYLFSGYGLRKISISSYKPLSFIHTHTKQIRDVCFHSEQMWSASVGMDKALKIVDFNSSSVVMSVLHEMPLWSCCWDANNSNVLYAGTQSGSVLKYDTRNIQEPLTTLSIPEDTSPVVAVASVPPLSTRHFTTEGVVSCKLNSLWFFEHDVDYVRHNLALEGPFVSMKYQKHTGQLLVSSRPNDRVHYSRHNIVALHKESTNAIVCSTVECFEGGGMQKLLSKSCFVSDQNDLVAAYHETNKCVNLWSVSAGQKVASVPSHDVVLDLCGIHNSDANFLLSLTEKKLEFFKFYH